MKNFRQSDNKLAYSYVLTPSGVVAKLALTHLFLASEERDFDPLQKQIIMLRFGLEHTTPPGAAGDLDYLRAMRQATSSVRSRRRTRPYTHQKNLP